MFVSKMSFSILNVVKTIKKAVCIPSIQMEEVFEGKKKSIFHERDNDKTMQQEIDDLKK